MQDTILHKYISLSPLLFTYHPPPPYPLPPGRPPTSETLDAAGSALSTTFRKPLATSNHYLGKGGREGYGSEGDRERERENRIGRMVREGKISDAPCFQSLNYSNVPFN